VPSRIDVELTSAREDGTWTWRAAGARQPKGSVDASLLYEGARVGDVVRADAEFALDGIAITHIHPPKEARPERDRLEILGPVKPPAEPAPKPARPRRTRAEGPPARQRREGAGARPPSQQAKADKASPRKSSHRLAPSHRHRAAALAALSPEQRPVAEEVLRGGLPAVRQAIQVQNAAARAEGRPEVPVEPLVALAEELAPRLKAAAWRDRAEAAMAAGDEISLRDLRSIVTGADAGARDDETRLLAAKLREALERRVGAARQRWVEEIAAALEGGKVVRALRASARPPDPGARFPAELALRLGQAAGEALGPSTPPEHWVSLLEAVASSPVRRTVKPSGLPAGGGPEVLEAARRAIGRVPALAGLLGLAMPPPPAPPQAPRRARSRVGPARV
jgi:hypothetical protein